MTFKLIRDQQENQDAPTLDKVVTGIGEEWTQPESRSYGGPCPQSGIRRS